MASMVLIYARHGLGMDWAWIRIKGARLGHGKRIEKDRIARKRMD